MAIKKVGFIGLGAMGLEMAKQLAAKGFDLTGCDVRPDAGAALREAGAKAAASPAQAGEGAQVLFVMVFNQDQIEAVLFGPDGCVDVLAPGAVVIVSSTVSPAYMRSLGKRLAERGLLFVDGPVVGGVPAARTGTLTYMASGSSEAMNEARPALDAVAGRIFHLGDEPGIGSSVKAVNQLLAGVHVAIAAEAMALGVRAGADPRVLYEVISAGAGTSVLFNRKVPQMLDANFVPPLSSVEIWVKDLAAVLELGRELRFPLPIGAATHQLYLASAAAGRGQQDYASVVRLYEDVAGVAVSTVSQPPKD